MELARPAAAGRTDSAEFNDVVARCHRQAYNYAYRLTGNVADAEDLTQESFLRAYRFFSRYDRSLPFENWLYRIMSRVFIDQLRRRPKIKTTSIDQPLSGDGDNTGAAFDIADFEANPESVVMHDMLDDRLQKALAVLPHDFRIAVILADIEGLSYEEIAEAMECSQGTIRSRLHRGRKLLRRLIGSPGAHGELVSTPARGYAS